MKKAYFFMALPGLGEDLPVAEAILAEDFREAVIKFGIARFEQELEGLEDAEEIAEAVSPYSEEVLTHHQGRVNMDKDHMLWHYAIEVDISSCKHYKSVLSQYNPQTKEVDELYQPFGVYCFTTPIR